MVIDDDSDDEVPAIEDDGAMDAVRLQIHSSLLSTGVGAAILLIRRHTLP